MAMVLVLRSDTAEGKERDSAKFVGLASLDECHEGTHGNQLSNREWMSLQKRYNLHAVQCIRQ